MKKLITQKKQHSTLRFHSVLWFVVFLFAFQVSWGQNKWDGNNPLGNFTYGNNWDPDRSDGVTGTWDSNTDLVFDNISNTSQTSIYFDYGAWKTVRSIYYNTGIPKSIDFNGDGNGFNIHQKIENYSSYAQNLTIPLSSQGTELQLNPINADLSFTANIYNNGDWIKIYGDNGKNIIFTNSGVISGTGGFTVEQNSNVYFNVAQTFTGSINITAGSINLGIDDAISNSSNLNLNGGAFNTSGYSDTLGTLTLQASSTINLGTGSHTLTFADSHSTSWAGSTLLTINGWGTGTNGKIYVGSDATGLTSDQLNQIQFTGYNQGAKLLTTGELVPTDTYSQIIAPSSQIVSTTISSLSDTVGESQEVFKFTVHDAAGDTNHTIITNMHFTPAGSNNADWTNTFQGFVITDGINTFTPTTTTITDTSIDLAFATGLSITEGNVDLILKAYLNTSNINDGAVVSFFIDADAHGFTTAASGSSAFSSTFSGGDFNSNFHTLAVVATELRFGTQPTNTEVNTAMTPAVTVKATDANGNTDIDYTTNVSLTSAGTLTGTPVSATPTAGVATYATLTHTVVGYNLTLAATSGSFTAINSNTFNITDTPTNCSQLYISEYGHYWTGSVLYGYVEIYNPTNSTISLDNYRISILYNGTGTPSVFTFTSNSNLAPGAVYVLADNDSNTVQNANQYEGLNYSGDDTIYLEWNGGSGSNYTVIDQVGDGTDITSDGWTVDGITDATNNNTIVRKKTVSSGNTNWSTSSSNEWIVSSFTEANLFFHHSNCNYYPCGATEETALNLDFETSGGYTPSRDEFLDDVNYRFFKRDSELNFNTNIQIGNLQGDYYFGVCDTDYYADPVSITINDIDITNLINLRFSIMLAEDDSSADGGQHWDADTNMHITYSVGNTNYDKNLLWVESKSGDNSEPAVDPNFNGVGNDGSEIISNFKEFTKDILETGNTLNIKVTFTNLDDYYQDIAIDNIKITGDKIPTSTYSSATWDTTPDATKKAIIDDNLTMNENIVACKCQVNADKTLTVDSNKTLTVVGAIENNGTVVVNDDASLVQITEKDGNSGSGTYQIKKMTSSFAQYDYTYFSSPIVGFDVSSLTGFDLKYSYDAGNYEDLYSSDVNGSYSPGFPQLYGSPDGFDDASPFDWQTASGVMSAGVGYIARGAAAQASGLEVNFATGTNGRVHNGVYTVAVEKDNHTNSGSDSEAVLLSNNNANLIGNPYPSALNAVAFYNQNSAVINPTFYFWTSNTEIAQNNQGPWVYNYNTNDFATFNAAGTPMGVAATTGGPTPTGYIASGQGFLVSLLEGTSGTSVTFNNVQRTAGNNNQFFRQANNNDRMWLNFTTEAGEVRPIAIGFEENAADTYDLFDSPRMENGTDTDFYSIADNGFRLAINRLSSFNTDKIIPLGLEIINEGTHQISIDHTEGIFTQGQAVYLEDTYQDVIHNLTESPYSFTSVAGNDINDRFVLRFTNTALANEELDLAKVNVYPNPSQTIFNISYFGDEMPQVSVYDINGKLLMTQNQTRTINLTNYAAGIYFAKINFSTGQKTVKLIKE